MEKIHTNRNSVFLNVLYKAWTNLIGLHCIPPDVVMLGCGMFVFNRMLYLFSQLIVFVLYGALALFAVGKIFLNLITLATKILFPVVENNIFMWRYCISHFLDRTVWFLPRFRSLFRCCFNKSRNQESEASCFCYKYYMQNILKFQAGFSFCPASRKSSCLKRKTREPTKNYMSVCWEIYPRVSTIYTSTSAVWFFIMTIISVQFSLTLSKPRAVSSVTNLARFTWLDVNTKWSVALKPV